MLQPMNRRRFLQALGAGALVLSRAVPARAATQGDRLVVAVGQWGIETPFAWRSSQSEKTLWDCVYNPLIMRDPKTFDRFVEDEIRKWADVVKAANVKMEG